MCFVWIWEQTAIISLYSINWLVFITETECVYYAVRTGSLYTILRSAHTVYLCFVWIWQQTAIIFLYRINWVVFITETECVYCAVRTGSIYTILHSVHTVIVCFVWIAEQTAIISLYSIKWWCYRFSQNCEKLRKATVIFVMSVCPSAWNNSAPTADFHKFWYLSIFRKSFKKTDKKSGQSFIHSVFCLTTGPKPPPKRFRHIVRSRASSFKWKYPVLYLRSSSSFLRLLPCLLVTSISPFIFPLIICFRRQFLRKMWPIRLAFRFLISCRIFLHSLTLSNTSSFLTWSDT